MKQPILRTAGAALVSVALLAGCSQPIKEVAEQSEESQSGVQSGLQSGAADDGLEITLTEDQAMRIVQDVQGVLDESSETKDSSILESRLQTPALEMRQGQLTMAEKTGAELTPLTITPDVYSATAGDSWPRVLVVASNAATEDPAELFFIVQEEPKGDYKLENWTRLIGGTSVKGMSVRDGSIVLDSDATGYEMTPADTISNYVNFLNSPDNAEYAVFEDNVFEPRYRSDVKTLNDAVSVAGNVTAQAQTGDFPVRGVALDTGAAVVSSAFTYQNVYTKTVAGSKMEMAGTPAKYLDDPAVKGSVTVNYLVMVFFLVPEEGSGEKVAVLGSERVITSVSREDTEPA